MDMLLPMAVMLDASDFVDPSIVVDRHPFFAACIAFAASTCVPGQEALRRALLTKIQPWMDAMPYSNRMSDEDELFNLKSLLVLYMSAKASILCNAQDHAEYRVHLWMVKSQSEMYARHIRLHQAVHSLAEAQGGSLKRTTRLGKYLCWLWLHTTCH
jgi:hypothetical protein